MQPLGDLVGGAQDRDPMAFLDMIERWVSRFGEVIG